MLIEGKLYDSDGNEIIVPQDHHLVITKEGMRFIPYSDEYKKELEKYKDIKLVYKPPIKGN